MLPAALARLPESLRKLSAASAEAAYDPAVLGAALGALLRVPAPIDLSHMAMPRVTVAERLAVLRDLLRRGTFCFDDAVKDADRVTVCVTVFALLELYKRGEAAWEQEEPFGPITVTSERRRGLREPARRGARRGRAPPAEARR